MSEAEFSINTSQLGRWFLLAFLLVVFLMEISVTLRSPIAFGDEAYHVSGARWIGANVEYPVDTPLHGSALHPERFNRLPLWNFMEASFYMLLGFSPAIVQILVPLLSLFTGLAIYVFGKRIFSEELAMIAAIIAVTIPSFVTYSVLFYTTVPYVFFFSMAFLTFVYSLKTHSRKFLLISAMFSTIAILINLAGMFMPVLYAVVAVFETINKRSFSGAFELLKRYVPVLLILLIFISPWVVRNLSLYTVEGCTGMQNLIQGNCRELQTYTPTQSFVGRTAEVGSEAGVLQFGILNYLSFSYGFASANNWLTIIGTAFVPATFLAGLFLLWKMRGKVELSLVLSALLFLFFFVQLGGFGTGRAEDTSRYFLSASPLIGLVSASFFSSFINFGKEANVFRKYKPLIYVFAIFMVIFLLNISITQIGLLQSFSAFDKLIIMSLFVILIGGALVIPFLIKDRTKELLIILITIVLVVVLAFANFSQKLDTMSRVKQFSGSFFEACDWIKQNTPTDSIFLSLHTYPTMYNCERQAVWEVPEKADIVLSNDVATSTQLLKSNGITHIFVQKFSLSATPYSQNYPVSFVNLLNSDENAFRKIYENGPTIEACAQTGNCDGGIVYEVL